MGKSSLPPKIRGIVEYQLEHYHESRRQLKEAEKDILPSNTPNYSLEPVSHSEASRATENTAIKIMQDRYLAAVERNVNAIDYVLSKLKDEDKRLIDLVYWKGTHTKDGAAMALHMSRRTVYRRVDMILHAIASELGYIPE